MVGVATAAPSSQIQAMIQQATFQGFNIFNLAGNVTISAVSIDLAIPVNTEITLKPTIITSGAPLEPAQNKTALFARKVVEEEEDEDLKDVNRDSNTEKRPRFSSWGDRVTAQVVINAGDRTA